MKRRPQKKTLFSFPFIFSLLSFLLILAPSFVSAQSRVTDIIGRVQSWLVLLVYIVISLAGVLFLWGVLKYITGGADEEKRRDGRNLILYGIIGLFVMVSVWALVYFLGAILGIHPGGITEMPGLPTPAGGFAATNGNTIVTIITTIGGWINNAVYLMITLAMFLFLWGVTKYVASGDDQEKRTEARNLIFYGVGGLFVMVAVWALVYFVGASIGIRPGGVITVPQVTSIELLKSENGNPAVTLTGTAMTCTDWASDKSFKSLVCLILKILNPIPPILIALAMLCFFWGIAKYMNAGGDNEKLKEGRNTIVFGILGLFIVVTVWVIVFLFQKELGLG